MAAGLTGRPNVDWCEFNKEETLKVNVVSQVPREIFSRAVVSQISRYSSSLGAAHVSFSWQAGTLLIADQCNKRGIHCTIFGTGCIYEYDADHTIGGKGFLENDPPNFDKSFYSKTKVLHH